MASAVAHRYARALADIVMTPGSALKPEDAIAQVAAVQGLIDESAELRTALMTPAIPTSRKRQVMGMLMERTGASPLIRNFIFVIIDHRRIDAIGDIREALEAQLDERLGFVRAQITSAAPLSPASSSGLESSLASLTGKRVRLEFQ
ncbi:MAG TPA: F0F1 ATP synthase subunit delta, partial [Bryobacteraceae bacterium]|nr:F0F1 ATP synthase subunit delta [Bryobacteraceae bacterium]